MPERPLRYNGCKSTVLPQVRQELTDIDFAP
jgi:hypothetical protein